MSDIKTLLFKGVVKFSYTKVDGEERIAYGTLLPDAVSGLGTTRKYIPSAAGYQTYYDLEKDDWRKFKTDNVKEIIKSVDLTATHSDLDTLRKNYRSMIEDDAVIPGVETGKEEEKPRRTRRSSEEKKKTILEDLLARYPKPSVSSGGFYVTDEVWKSILTNIYGLLNTLMVGPAGTGKTELVRHACQSMGIPYHHYNIGTMTDVQASLIGSHVIDSEGHSEFAYSQFVADIQEPGVIMLDELNRNPQALNVLTNVLDGIRELNVSGTGARDAASVKVHPACVFFATANLGASYTGTTMLDEAIETRFDYVGVGYIPEPEEASLLEARTGCSRADALRIARVARQVRDLNSKDELSKSISTRETLRIAQKVSIGNTVKSAFESLLMRFEGTNAEGERGIVFKIIQTV